MKRSSRAVADVGGEFSSFDGGDARVDARVQKVCRRLCRRPDLSFPRVMKTERETEGFYRLLSNPRVTYRGLVSSHAKKTVERMAPGSTVRVVHDTTEVKFSGETEREGLSKRSSTSTEQVFFAHTALALSCDEVARPLGVVGMKCWARTGPARSSRKLSGAQLAKLKDKESNRWGELVEEVEGRIEDRAHAIHLMDREGDSYPLFCAMVERSRRFVVRMARDRVVFFENPDDGADETIHLSEALLALPHRTSREVQLSRRAKTTMPRLSKTHPPRDARVATLAVSAGIVTLKRPRFYTDELPESLTLNVVYAQEVDASPEHDPVAWVLITTEPISTSAEIEAVIDHYRHRWVIEEFFKALKTGCSFEERQLESFKTLTNALALFVPIAWQMLLLRAVSRATPDAPATAVLTATQIEVLRHYQPDKMPKSGATAFHALMAVAGLGGHLKRNGLPGWRTLSYGMQELVTVTEAWEAGARSAAKRARDTINH